MTRVQVIIVVIALIIIGVIGLAYTLRDLKKRLEYTVGYRVRFLDFYEHIKKNGNIENPLYYELVQEVNKIQLELGIDGIVSIYHDPIKGVQIRNYPLMLNLFNDLRSEVLNYDMFADRIYLAVGSCDEAMVKHIGNLEEAMAIGRKRIINPFYCFGNGISLVISLPVRILLWSGIINRSISDRILSSKCYDILSKVATVLGLIASIITIILGWDKVSDLFNI